MCKEVKGICRWMDYWDFVEKTGRRGWGIGTYILYFYFFSTLKLFSFSLPDPVVPGFGFHLRVSEKKDQFLNVNDTMTISLKITEQSLRQGWVVVSPHMSKLDLFLLSYPVDQTTINVYLSNRTPYNWNGRKGRQWQDSNYCCFHGPVLCWACQLHSGDGRRV